MKQTKVISADGQELILFHEKDITEAEIKFVESFTAAELKYWLKEQGFREHKLDQRKDFINPKFDNGSN